MTIDKWNQIREEELILFLKKKVRIISDFSHFPKKTDFRCSECNELVHDEAHIDDSGRFPKRQVVCTMCQKTDYRYLNDIEMAMIHGKK